MCPRGSVLTHAICCAEHRHVDGSLSHRAIAHAVQRTVGMEGATVTGLCGTAAGLLLSPLRHKGLGVDLHFAITLQALSAAITSQLPGLGHPRCQPLDHQVATSLPIPRAIELESSPACGNGEELYRAPCFAAAPALMCTDLALVADPRPNSATTSSTAASRQDVASACLHVTALVRCGSSWATGVLLDVEAGLVLTNAHAVKAAALPLQVRG